MTEIFIPICLSLPRGLKMDQEKKLHLPEPWKGIHVHSTDSTNQLLPQRFGESPWSCVIADTQNAGHGRRGRSWESPEGGLWMSATLPLTENFTNFQSLTLMTGLAVLRALDRLRTGTPVSSSATQQPLGLKWPNDIVTSTGLKIGGIIAKTWFQGSRPGPLLIGLGLNLENPIPPELKEQAQNLAALSPHLPGEGLELRIALTRLILQELHSDYLKLKAHGFQIFQQEMRDKCTTLGQDINILSGQGKQRAAKALDIDSLGRLMVSCNGQIAFLDSGEISIRPCSP